MTPQARVQAAIELLDEIIVAARDGGAAADTIISRYFAVRRYAGSKDRRAVRDLVYDAVRSAGERPETGRATMLGLAKSVANIATLFDDSPHAPSWIDPSEPVAEAGLAPKWLVMRLEKSGVDATQQRALIERAPLDVRINDLVPTMMDAIGEPIVGVPNGRRLPSGTNVEALDAFRTGGIEVQDAGSQIVTMAADAQPGQRIVDLCAGAGGKSLTLAAAMGNRGLLLATDTDRTRLARLAPRALRAGVSIIETRLLNPGCEKAALSDWDGQADCVLIDAPCSGTGTWRRNPEARWRLTPSRLDRLVATQRHVLEIGAPLVRAGGSLVYIVCSLLDEEGTTQIETFLQDIPGWTFDLPTLPAGVPHGVGISLMPGRDSTDGFFVARLRRSC